MAFLQPFLLALGAAVAVPLILHLFHRHHGPRVVFPALRYLRRAEKESARKVKLRQILLLLLRVAAVLLIAFAAARPFVRTGGATHEPTAVVIILDNSMSSGAVVEDERMLDVLKARAIETLSQGEPEDRFWLLRAGATDEPAYPGDALSTAARVRETEPTAARADLTAAVARAAAILDGGSGGRAREIQLLSDLQATDFAAAVPASPGTALIVWQPPRDAPRNRSITAVEIGGGIAPGANERSSISATIAGDAADTVNVRLVVDERLAAAARTTAGGSAVLNLPARPAGILTGRVEMDADALRADNRRYFAAAITPPPGVAVSGPLPFVEEALAALEAAGRIRRASPAGAAVLLSQGAAGGNAVAEATLVVLPPESPLELEAANRRLALQGIPWSYALQPSPGEARFRMRDSTDAVLRTLESARLSNVYALRAGEGGAADSVLLHLRDGSPWAVRGRRAGGGRYILLGSPLTEAASSIPTSAAMLPLLDRIIRVWSVGGSGTEQALPGAVVALPAGATAVQRPDSVEEPVTGGSYHVPPLAGVYRIMSSDRMVSAFAVNPPAPESDLQRVDADRLRALLQGWTVATADDGDEWQRDTYRQRLGRELWRPLLFALLAVLALEAVIAATGGLRRRAAAGGSAATVEEEAA